MINRFVVIIYEDYDCYTIGVPYPITTGYTKEELQEQIKDKFLKASENKEISYILIDIYENKTFPILLHHLIDNCFINEDGEYVRNPDGSYAERYHPLDILTVDEWFNSNVMFNTLWNTTIL